MEIQRKDLKAPTKRRLQMTEQQACTLLFKLRDDDKFRALLKSNPANAFRSLGLSFDMEISPREAAKAIPSKARAREAIKLLDRAQRGELPYLNWDYRAFALSVLTPRPRPRKPAYKK